MARADAFGLGRQFPFGFSDIRPSAEGFRGNAGQGEPRGFRYVSGLGQQIMHGPRRPAGEDRQTVFCGVQGCFQGRNLGTGALHLIPGLVKTEFVGQRPASIPEFYQVKGLLLNVNIWCGQWVSRGVKGIGRPHS